MHGEGGTHLLGVNVIMLTNQLPVPTYTVSHIPSFFLVNALVVSSVAECAYKNIGFFELIQGLILRNRKL